MLLEKVCLASCIFSDCGREKKSEASLKTSSWEKERGALVRYAKPVVAKTLCRSLLRARRSDGDGEGEERIERSTMGSEENEVVILSEEEG